MAFSKGNISIDLNDILKEVSEADILSYYLGITEIPCVIHSPLRIDNKPSFGLYSRDGIRIYYNDFSSREKGGIFDLLSSLWKKNYKQVLEKIYKDIPKLKKSININTYKSCIKPQSSYNNTTNLECKIREWKDYDLEYWGSYGITLEWLKYAEVYPISHKIIIKGDERFIFGTDKYAYVYVEHKENKVTLKIYQPFNTKGFKWANKHDSSVLSLWTKVPKFGSKICICSSLKDALCLWINTKIPAIAVQGEGYSMSDTAINELKRRYEYVFICFDNDEAGLLDGEKLSKETGFINIVLPKINNCKDISDLYKSVGKEEFINIVFPLFNIWEDDLPF